MAKNKVTLKEMADILEVSIATISKALHDSEDISDAMVKKVKKLADELGYRPNRLAKGLISDNSYLIGAIIPDLRISFFSEAARGIYEQARKHGYQAILMVNDEDPDTERENIEFLSDIKIDGLLLNPTPGRQNYALYQQVSEEGIPIVCWDRKLDELGYSAVTIDDYQAARRLTNKLIQKGRQDILFIGPNSGFSVAEERFQGYCDAMKENGNPVNIENDCILADVKAEACYKGMKSYLVEKGHDFDAILCLGGMVAYGAGHAILEEGLTIPQDVMLAEFGDNDIVSQLGVSFYTIEQNPYDIGKTSLDLLVDKINTKDRENNPEHIIIDTKLIHHQVGKPFFKSV